MRQTCLHLSAFAALAAMPLVAESFWTPAAAEAGWDWALHCFKKPDIDVLHGLIQQMLKEAPTGSRQAWCSTTGKRGFVYLLAGGDKAGTVTATVRITVVEGNMEQPWFVFQYRKDPVRGWGVVG